VAIRIFSPPSDDKAAETGSSRGALPATAPIPATTEAVTRGVARLFLSIDLTPVREVTLKGGRRVDVVGVGKSGEIVVAEVKSCLNDFRSDRKWREYLDHCDRFFFAVDEAFPNELLPSDVGLIVADKYGGAIVRPSPELSLNAARRKALHIKIARTAADRLARAIDPDAPYVSA